MNVDEHLTNVVSMLTKEENMPETKGAELTKDENIPEANSNEDNEPKLTVLDD